MCQKATANMTMSNKSFLVNQQSKLYPQFTFLNSAKGNPKFGCGKFAEIFKTGKFAAANILKEGKNRS